MAIGFTPKHNEDISLNQYSQEQFLVLCNETAIQLKWNISYISNNGLIAYTDNGMLSSNAEIKIKIEEGMASIQSASIGNEMIDWGKNKKM